MKTIRLVILGDSLTAGCHETGVTPETTYASLLRLAFTRAGLHVEVIVSALHGVYTNYAVRRFDRMVLQHAPDYVLILLGSNDAGSTPSRPTVSPDEYRMELNTLVERCLQNDAFPIVASPPPRLDLRCRDSLKRYAEMSQVVARRFDIPFADLYGNFADGGSLKDLFPDGLHPNPAGNKVIAELLAPVLVRYLRDDVTQQCGV